MAHQLVQILWRFGVYKKGTFHFSKICNEWFANECNILEKEVKIEAKKWIDDKTHPPCKEEVVKYIGRPKWKAALSKIH